jgi:hypothetical protein
LSNLWFSHRERFPSAGGREFNIWDSLLQLRQMGPNDSCWGKREDIETGEKIEAWEK